MKIVIDTNVLVSGLQSDMGYSHKLLEMLPSDEFDVCISVPLILEYEEQLKKHLPPEIFTEEDIDDFIDYICRIAKKTPIFYLWRPHLKDPFDDHVLELALASQSTYIVTFNKRDFRGTEQYGIHIVNPGEFIRLLEERR
ncbi:MAG: putative toxin-antitoxin system toxin component, PIN family [Lachnospiraceae bacterium]|nr:putative toxin-antitoxin system toxin component, PIN family [Lachnospiraceae bacterium]